MVVNKQTQVLECKQGAVRAVRFNVDGNYCLTCGSDKSLKLWNPLRGLHLKTYTGHGYEVLDACGSSDNSAIASCGMDKSVVLFDVSSGQATRKYRDHAGTVNCVAFNEDSTLILSGSIDCSVRVWDARSRKNQPVQVMDEAGDSVTSIICSDHEILTGCADSNVRRYDLRIGRMSTDFVGKPVACARFTRDSQCLLVSAQGAPVRLFDKDTGEMLNEFEGAKNSNYKIESCLNQTDTHVLSGSEDGKVIIWDLVEGRQTGRLEHPSVRAVHAISHHPSLPALLTAQADKVYLWEDNQQVESEETPLMLKNKPIGPLRNPKDFLSPFL